MVSFEFEFESLVLVPGAGGGPFFEADARPDSKYLLLESDCFLFPRNHLHGHAGARSSCLLRHRFIPKLDLF